MTIRLIALDADDTLWHNETFYRLTQARFTELLAPYADAAHLAERLAAAETRNLAVYGYGVKGFTLSMLEAALEVTEQRVPSSILAEVLACGREMMRHPVDLLPGVEAAVASLAERGRLVLITKGDLFHQESKLAASGLGERFEGVEVVSQKTPEVYARIFARHGAAPGEAVMAGNSVRSDILPVLEAGGWAALVPYPLVWEHEAADPPTAHARFTVLERLGELPDWIATLG